MVQGLLSRHPPLHVQLLRTSPGSAQNEGKWLAFWLRKNQFSPDVSKKIRRALRREQDKPTETKRKIATMNILIQQARRGLQGRSAPALRDIRKATKAHITLTDRLRSGYHRFWYEATQALRWSRGTYRDVPAMTRLNLTPSQRARIDTLAENYTTRFELRYPPETTLLNYGYLDLLDRASQTLNWSISRNQKICDVGSSHFAYAAALQAFFHPSHLIGTEVDGYRLFCNGRSRIDYAHGHIQDLPHTNYVVTDYRQYHQPAEIITAWYPFVTPKPLLAWRRSLSVFNPAALFAQIANNLVIGGTFVMINHNPTCIPV